MFHVGRLSGREVLKCSTPCVAERRRFCRQDGEAKVQRTEHRQSVVSQHQPGYGGLGGSRPREPGGGRPGLGGEPGVWAPTPESGHASCQPLAGLRPLRLRYRERQVKSGLGAWSPGTRLSSQPSAGASRVRGRLGFRAQTLKTQSGVG